MRTLRAPLLTISSLLLLALACTTLSGLFGGEAPGTEPGIATPLPTSTPEPSADEAPALPTEGEARRREIDATPTPFRVTDPDDVRTALDLANPDFNDSFNDEATWFDYNTAGRAAYWFEDGQLIGKDYEPEEIFAWWSYSDRPAGNSYAEVSITNGDCIDKDSVGLVVRVNETQAAGGYALEVSCDGSYRYLRHRIGKQAEEVIGWTESDLINTGEGATNRLGIWGYQGDLEFFINGNKVADATDPNYSYKRGLFGLYVRGFATYDLTAFFDDFAFWHIPFQQ